MIESVVTVDVRSVATEKTLGVIDPATGEVLADVPDGTREQLDNGGSMPAGGHVIDRPGQRDPVRSRRLRRNGTWSVDAFTDIETIWTSREAPVA